jgi:hypothetical protein
MRLAAIPLGPLSKLKKGFWFGSGSPGFGGTEPTAETFAVSCCRRAFASLRVAWVVEPSRKSPAKRRRTVVTPPPGCVAVGLLTTNVSCPSHVSEPLDVVRPLLGFEVELVGAGVELPWGAVEVVNSSPLLGWAGCLVPVSEGPVAG